MERLAGRPLFTVGKRRYTWDDVMTAAELWGERRAIERRIREGVACLKHLERTGEELSEGEADEAADAWRYDRDLLAADDLQGWLDEHRLEFDEWLEYLQRSAARDRLARDLQSVTKKYKVRGEEVDALFYAEALCSGDLADLAQRLAGRAAVFDRLASDPKTARTTRCSKAALRTATKRVRESRRSGAAAERAEFLACVDITFRRFVDGAASAPAIDRELEAHRLEWTRLDCQTAPFESDEAAREAALLVREDHLSLADAAKMAKSSVAKVSYVIDDVSPPLHERLVGARPDDLIGPLVGDGHHLLVSVIRRVEPSAKDVQMRRRAAEAIVRRTIQREVEKRVRWHERV